MYAVGPMQFYEFRFYRKEHFFVKFVSPLPKHKRNHLVYMTPISPLFPITRVLHTTRIPGIRSEISYKNYDISRPRRKRRRIVFPETFPFRFGRFAGRSSADDLGPAESHIGRMARGRAAVTTGRRLRPFPLRTKHASVTPVRVRRPCFGRETETGGYAARTRGVRIVCTHSARRTRDTSVSHGRRGKRFSWN